MPPLHVIHRISSPRSLGKWYPLTWRAISARLYYQGELFGLENMFTLGSEETVRMHELVEREHRSAAEFYRIERHAQHDAAAAAAAAPDDGGSQPQLSHSQWRRKGGDGGEGGGAGGGGGGGGGGTAVGNAAMDAEGRRTQDGEDGGGRGGGRGRARARGLGREERGLGSITAEMHGGEGVLDREADGVLYEHRHDDIMGRTTKAEDARTRKARQEVRDAEGAEAEPEAEDANMAAGAERKKRVKRDVIVKPEATGAPAPAAACGAGGSSLSAAEWDADDVLAALALFEGMPR